MYHMMETFTVSFFGHRTVANITEVEKELKVIIRDLISTKEYVEFLVGRDGEFDQIVSSVIRRCKRIYNDSNSSHVLVLPYPTADYKNNLDYLKSYYDEIEICANASAAHFKAAIQIRNREMIDRSNLSVFLVERESGGAYLTLQYALKQNKEIINLAKQSE